MNKYLLDTDICAFYLSKKYSLREKIAAVGEENCFISEITIAELLFGAHKSNDYESNKEDPIKIMKFANLVRLLPSYDLYGKEKARLQKSGQIIPEFDLLIATTAVYHGMTLVTNNTKHMGRIEGIQLENWTLAEDNRFIS